MKYIAGKLQRKVTMEVKFRRPEESDERDGTRNELRCKCLLSNPIKVLDII